MSKTNKSIWQDIEKSLNELDKQELINLLKNIYEKSTDTEMLINAKFDKKSKRVLENYRKKIIKAFMTDKEPPELPKIKEGMSAISDYKSATKDLAGTIDLIITYSEHAIKYSNELCYDEEDLENSVYDLMQEMKDIILENKAERYLESFSDELLKLHKLADKAEDFMFEAFIGEALEEIGLKESDDE
ncbi:MAG: hypothetical protein WCK67_01145 [bacterium]